MFKLETKWTQFRELSEERMKICEVCDRYNAKIAQCQECGCFMKAKTSFPNSKCPLNKWGPMTDKKK